jgi:hypothetical protein
VRLCRGVNVCTLLYFINYTTYFLTKHLLLLCVRNTWKRQCVCNGGDFLVRRYSVSTAIRMVVVGGSRGLPPEHHIGNSVGIPCLPPCADVRTVVVGEEVGSPLVFRLPHCMHSCRVEECPHIHTHQPHIAPPTHHTTHIASHAPHTITPHHALPPHMHAHDAHARTHSTHTHTHTHTHAHAQNTAQLVLHTSDMKCLHIAGNVTPKRNTPPFLSWCLDFCVKHKFEFI